MITDILFSAGSLALILLSCFLFTNAVEWFGKKLNLGQGIVGSIFAAVGTALPETVIPIIAIVFYHSEGSKEVGVGAIAGAPFMLSTLAFFVTGLAVVINAALKRRKLRMNVEAKVVSRDLLFFLIIYTLAVLTTLVRSVAPLKNTIAVLLMLSYIIYLKISFSGDSGECEDLGPLFFAKIFKAKVNMAWIVAQLAVALAGILLGANFFVTHIESLSNTLGVAPLILSIIITPIATELPEKLNSIIWIGRNKDTLALGNITGAMVFQSCFPVVFGILLTDWNLTGITLASAVIAIASAAINLVWIKVRGSVNPFMLLFGGVMYAALMVYIF